MDNQIVMITGAAGALGQVVSRFFLSQGATVIAVDLRQDVLKTLYEKQKNLTCVACDLTNAEATGHALAPAIQAIGSPAVLCNIAGGFDMGPPVHQTPDDLWRRLMDLNVATLINASRAVVPSMSAAGRGVIVNVAAASAVAGKAGMGAYCASKSSVARLTESMSFELRDQGINVNAVAPSILDTPPNRQSMPDADFSKWVSLEDLATVIGFLCSQAGRSIHGVILPVTALS